MRARTRGTPPIGSRSPRASRSAASTSAASEDEAEATAASNGPGRTAREAIVVKSPRRAEFKLSKKQVDVSTDIDGMVDEALRVAQEDGILARTWRRITGGEVDESIEPSIAYDEDEVEHVHRRRRRERQPGARQRERRARAAASLAAVRAPAGRQRRRGQTSPRRSTSALSDGRPRVAADVEKVKPEVTTDELAEQYPTYIVVDRSNFTLRLYKNLSSRRATRSRSAPPATTRRPGCTRSRTSRSTRSGTFPTPTGPATSPAPSSRRIARQPAQGPLDGHLQRRRHPRHDDIGSLGSAASHGCVRMAVPRRDRPLRPRRRRHARSTSAERTARCSLQRQGSERRRSESASS